MSHRWRLRFMAVLLVALLGGLLAGCDNELGMAYDWNGSYRCDISELQHLRDGDLFEIILMNSLLSFENLGIVPQMQTSQVSEGTAEFSSDREGGGPVMLQGTVTRDGDNITVILDQPLSTAASSSPAQVEQSMEMDLTITGDGTAGGNAFFTEDGVTYTGTVDIEKIAD